MFDITLLISKKLKKEMDAYPGMNWSAAVCDAFARRLALLGFEEFTRGSKLTGEDAIELGRRVNKSLAERYRKML